jgi:pimeloyl-ACP methyl ester carboxylesterase
MLSPHRSERLMIKPFHLAVPEADLADLRDRLRRTRWPEADPSTPWVQGVPLDYAQRVCRYWAEAYDWRRAETELNGLGQFTTEIGGVDIHALHVPAADPDAVPLLLSHGWPGSVAEMLDVIPILTDPAAHGFEDLPAMHVVCPSLPGYGFSAKPATTGWGVERIAEAWLELASRVGYGRVVAAGTDWGTTISTEMALRAPDRLLGIHLTPPLVGPDPATAEDMTAAEQEAVAAVERATAIDSGYSEIHRTRPQTIGYGLVDSPAALLTWILDKVWSWTDTGGTPDEVIALDRLLDDVMLYWLPATGASAARLYLESIAKVSATFRGPATDRIEVPTGCAIYPRETIRPSRRWAARRFANIHRWTELDFGGHFPALEDPRTYAYELLTFAAHLRPAGSGSS